MKEANPLTPPEIKMRLKPSTSKAHDPNAPMAIPIPTPIISLPIRAVLIGFFLLASISINNHPTQTRNTDQI
jgi:hypothetical protein